MRKEKHVYSSISGDITLSNDMLLDLAGYNIGGNTDMYLGRISSADGLRELLLSHWYSDTDIENIVKEYIKRGDILR